MRVLKKDVQVLDLSRGPKTPFPRAHTRVPNPTEAIRTLETMDQPLPRECVGMKPIKLGANKRPGAPENC